MSMTHKKKAKVLHAQESSYTIILFADSDANQTIYQEVLRGGRINVYRVDWMTGIHRWKQSAIVDMENEMEVEEGNLVELLVLELKGTERRQQAINGVVKAIGNRK